MSEKACEKSGREGERSWMCGYAAHVCRVVAVYKYSRLSRADVFLANSNNQAQNWTHCSSSSSSSIYLTVFLSNLILL